MDPRLASLTGLQSLFAQCSTLIPVDIREHQSSASHRTNITFDAFVQFLTSATNTTPACSYYAKDIHLERLFPASDLFCFPSEFADDWLGDYFKYLHPEDDYTFLYVGGPQSSTGFHCDVLHSCSVSHNITGAKLWTLWPPHPALRKLQECDSNGYDNITLSKSLIEMPRSELIQQEGETIFVPSGWFHTVQNLSPLVISVNKNWCTLSLLLVLFFNILS